MKKHTFGLLLAACSLLLSGFALQPPAAGSMEKTFTFRITTTIQSNGSGNVKAEAILSPDLVNLLESSSDNFSGEEFCSTAESGQSLFHFMLTNENGGIQCTAVEPFEDLNELESIMGSEGLNASFLRLEIEDGHLYYNVRLNMPESQSSPSFSFEEYWVLVLPGTLGENNADTVAGNTLTWDLTHHTGWTNLIAESFLPKEASSIRAGGISGMEPTTIAIIASGIVSCCCCVILLLAAGIATLLVLRKKKQPAPEEHSPDTIILAS
jgi:hypothetical protein